MVMENFLKRSKELNELNYKENPKKEIEKCLNFLLNESNS